MYLEGLPGDSVVSKLHHPILHYHATANSKITRERGGREGERGGREGGRGGEREREGIDATCTSYNNLF